MLTTTRILSMFSIAEFSDGLSSLMSRCLPAVVTIGGLTSSLDEVTGSGFAIDGLGHIVTNHHVVEGLGDRLTLILHGGELGEAHLVGVDPVTDLAIVHTNDSPTAHLSFRKESPILGELCIAIGSPLGEFTESVSLGVVSGVRRSVPAVDGSWPIEHGIQTDAAINAGNSGGPLVDAAGKVLGINQSKRIGESVEGIGFAVPAETAAKIAAELITYGCIQRARLGVTVAPKRVLLGERAELRLIITAARQPGGDLREGDVLLTIDGCPIRDRGDLFLVLDRNRIDRSIVIEVSRDGKKVALEARMKAAP